MHAPQKVVVEFLRLGPFETRPPGIPPDSSHEEMPDHAILAAGVQSLQHDQQRMLLLRVHHVLQPIQFL